jgi:hypothetical protein
MSEPMSPSMSDLAEPAARLRLQIEERIPQVKEYFDAIKETTTEKRFVSTLMYMTRGKALLEALAAFNEACELVEDAV